jgi:hypothetical protein
VRNRFFLLHPKRPRAHHHPQLQLMYQL